jgi:hypothetical protein
MKIFNHFLSVITSVFLSSATPNLFGSQKRKKAKAELAGTFKEAAGETQKEIEALKVQNPFETAAAKSAMTEASRRAKQTQQRFANVLGGNINPEAVIAAQQASQEAVAGTAGDIATGAEANKAAQLAQLRGEKAGQLQQSAGIQMESIAEQGQGWKDFFSSLDSIGNLATSASGVLAAI